MDVTENELTIEGVIQELGRAADNETPLVQRQISGLIYTTEGLGKPYNSHISGDALQKHLRSRLNQKRHFIEHSRVSAPLLAELAAAGVEVPRSQSVANLNKDAQKRALPVLLDWYNRETAKSLHDEIRDALTMPWAGSAAVPAFLAEFQSIDPKSDLGDDNKRWFIIQAAARRATVKWESDFLDIALDRSQETFIRYWAITALGRFSAAKERLTPLMLEFLSQDDRWLFLPAAKALAHWRVAEAGPRIQALFDASAEDVWLGDQLRSPLRMLYPDWHKRKPLPQ